MFSNTTNCTGILPQSAEALPRHKDKLIITLKKLKIHVDQLEMLHAEGCRDLKVSDHIRLAPKKNRSYTSRKDQRPPATKKELSAIKLRDTDKDVPVVAAPSIAAVANSEQADARLLDTSIFSQPATVEEEAVDMFQLVEDAISSDIDVDDSPDDLNNDVAHCCSSSRSSNFRCCG
jgi:hypothetical protein